MGFNSGFKGLTARLNEYLR